MQSQARVELLPQDYLAWQEDFSNEKSAIFGLQRNSWAIWIGVAGLSVVLVLAYCATKNSAIASAPSSPSIEEVNRLVAKSSSEIEALRAVISEQNATNQQIVTTIDALRSEQQELRKQIAAMKAAKQSGSSPQTKAFPTKKGDHGKARQVPYPPDARQAPYPRLN